MSDFRPYKLGKLAPRRDPRTLKLSAYVSPTRLAPPPDHVDWGDRVPNWPMYANDQIGDCAIAGPAHQHSAWTAEAVGSPVFIRDADVIAAYSDVSGFDPRTGANDNGCVLLDVLKYWRARGIGGRKIGAYASVDPDNHTLVATACWLFGGLTIGLALPLGAQALDVWRAPSRYHRWGEWAPGSWGGHCVIIVAYDAWGLTCVTWGALKKMSWNFFEAYCDEAWAALALDWFDGTKKAPNGFGLEKLQADLAVIPHVRAA